MPARPAVVGAVCRRRDIVVVDAAAVESSVAADRFQLDESTAGAMVDAGTTDGGPTNQTSVFQRQRVAATAGERNHRRRSAHDATTIAAAAVSTTRVEPRSTDRLYRVDDRRVPAWTMTGAGCRRRADGGLTPVSHRTPIAIGGSGRAAAPRATACFGSASWMATCIADDRRDHLTYERYLARPTDQEHAGQFVGSNLGLRERTPEHADGVGDERAAMACSNSWRLYEIDRDCRSGMSTGTSTSVSVRQRFLGRHALASKRRQRADRSRRCSPVSARVLIARPDERGRRSRCRRDARYLRGHRRG